MTLVEANGIHLNVEVSGRGPALLLLHGFTGSGDAWLPLAEAWPDLTCVRVDLIGHGRSDAPADPARYRMEPCARDLVSLLDRLAIERACVIGYSMGGRAALQLAMHAPQRLWALVLESASPGIEDADERASRVESDEALADTVERDGLEAFVDYWQGIPLFASQARLPPEVRERQRRERLASSPIGLANSLRGMGAGAQEPLNDRLGGLSMPVLLIAGSLDAKYRGLTRQMAEAIPCVEARIIEDAGHAPHLEKPDLFAAMVREFIDRRVD